MTHEERIAQHKKTIESFRRDIKWLEDSQFTITGQSTANLIEKQNSNINMYEGFIARLEEQDD